MTLSLRTIIGRIRPAFQHAHSVFTHSVLPGITKAWFWVCRCWLPLLLAGLCLVFGLLGFFLLPIGVAAEART